MTAVSLLFGLYFDYANIPESTGHAVDIRVQLRDANGNILYFTDKHLDAFYSGGWVRIDWPKTIKLTANQEYILTWYLINGENIKLTNGSEGDYYAGFTSGRGFGADIIPGENIDSWDRWSEHPWDFCFKIHRK